MIPVRWQSGSSQGGGGAERRHGFFANFLANLQKGLERNKDMQESLKGFHEERSKLQQSYYLQAAREKLAKAKVSCNL